MAVTSVAAPPAEATALSASVPRHYVIARLCLLLGLKMTDLLESLQASLGTAYTLERELGGGGMSRVFVARETALGRSVVIKVLPGEMAGQVSMDRFMREIALAARLQHPHIVPLHSAGEASGLPYFTMPFVEGESLRARLARHGEFPISDGVRMLREIASALAYAHSHGVVHRDIKPDNVLLSGGVAMVTDFGVAKALSASTDGDQSGGTSQGVALGTPGYMAPEQATADPAIDHRADVYAFGVLAYELLAGQPPFAGRTPQALLAAHVSEAPEPIALRRSSVPAALGSLVMQCLEKRPADRPQSAEEVVRALDAIVGGTKPAPAAQGTRGVAGWFGLRRMVGVSAVVSVVVLVATVGYAARQRALGPRSIAVLPCDNASRDTAFDYIAEGMSDELRTQLRKEVPNLTVTARSSSVAFKGSRVDVRAIGKSLKVATVLQCTVSRLGSSIHVTSELVNTADGSVIWNDALDRDAKDFSVVKDSITRSVAGALKLALASLNGRARQPQNPLAHDLYLRGQFALNKASEPDLRQALLFFDRALEKDSSMAEAYAGIAWTWGFFADAYMSPAEAYPKAKVAALKAIALDSTIAEAYSALAMATAMLDWDFTGGESLLRRSIELNPKLAESHSMYAVLLAWRGRFDEGIAEADRALAIDPLSPIASLQRELALMVAGRSREAVEQHRRTLLLEPRFFYLVSGDALGYRALGILDSSLAAEERDQKLNEGRPPYGRAITLARLGRIAEAKAVAAELEAAYKQRYFPPELVAVALANAGEMDRAFMWMDRVFETRSAIWIGFSYGDDWAALRRDPRWAQLKRRANIR